MARPTVPMLVLAAAVALAGCGDDDTADTADTAETTAAETSAAATEADVLFVRNMIPHHEQAVEMAALALDPAAGAGPEVTDLATRIQAAQGPEIERMSGWMEAWGEPMDDHGGADHDMAGMEGMAGMMSAEDMAALGEATGPDFDQMWIEMMIAHHQGAIEMAEAVQADGADPDVRELAGAIIAAQQAEIEEMQALLGG